MARPTVLRNEVLHEALTFGSDPGIDLSHTPDSLLLAPLTEPCRVASWFSCGALEIDMQRIHPDRGGSRYLAAAVDRAMVVLPG